MSRFLLVVALALAGSAWGADSSESSGKPVVVPDQIKAYCLDFNWMKIDGRRRMPFAPPGHWHAADPAQHVAWYKAIGANVIQTFCVSLNGYAWYKNGFVPEQPGLQHDFLPEMVRLGHQEGMLVFGYFCTAANSKWAEDHPELSYDAKDHQHIPYTDEYLAYLAKSVTDAVVKTGIDGFMIDWLWVPSRASTKGKWIECEKALYQTLMGEPFPGEDQLARDKETAYARKSIARCWDTIRTAAKTANPNCLIWITVNNLKHPHVVGSAMYQETDWLMNEAGDMKAIDAIKSMVGPKTRLITCLAEWNGKDPGKIIPEAVQAGVGLYGFTCPRKGTGVVDLAGFMKKPLTDLKGDQLNISSLARWYHGVGPDAVWNGADGFVTAPQP